jgi:hypothetical protein
MAAASFLTTTSSLSCPHGGHVTLSTSSSRVKADGMFVMRSTDQFTISGCSYKIGPTPHPCVRVKWDVHAERHKTDGDPSLTTESVGLCVAADEGAQGTVEISSAQRRGAGT